MCYTLGTRQREVGAYRKDGMRHIYLIERVGETPYDEHSGFVVTANGPSEARRLAHEHTGETSRETWMLSAETGNLVGLGEAKPNLASKVLLASFVAG